MDVTTAAINDYLTRYAATLTEFDAEGAADLWSTPGMIVSDHFSGTLDSRELMITGLKQSYPLYARLGLASVGHELLEANPLSNKLTLVKVRWLFLDANRDMLTDSTSYYLLRNEASGLQACVCIETDSAEKIQALADAHGIDLTQETDRATTTSVSTEG